MSVVTYEDPEKKAVLSPADESFASPPADVFGNEDDHDIQYKTLSWQVSIFESTLSYPLS